MHESENRAMENGLSTNQKHQTTESYGQERQRGKKETERNVMREREQAGESE